LIIIAAALSAMTLTRYGVTLLVVGAIVLYIRTKDAKNIASQ
jgi:uncharacterized protein YjeT (DUF2065 family)